jgi:F0F1-type ATP synthase membrane subunit c/vacuolar-type H+-ATPase subunit K
MDDMFWLMLTIAVAAIGSATVLGTAIQTAAGTIARALEAKGTERPLVETAEEWPYGEPPF